MRPLLLFILVLLFTSSISAQTVDKKWNIGFLGGAAQYKGELGNDFYRSDMAFYGMGGISISRYIGTHFDLNLLATKGTIGYSRPSGSFNQNVSTAGMNFRFHLLGPSSVVRPFLFIGGGFLLFDKNINITSKNVDYAAPSCGAGINFQLAPSVMLNIQENYIYSSADNRDGKISGVNDAYLFHLIGISFNFGNKKDEDADGVADRLDKCSNTPKALPVDKQGCPIDQDKDGVADYLDACPDQFGFAALKGCPDHDQDGIADKEDECPDASGTVALMGCPDKDGDAIADKDDRCPDAAGFPNLKGCPDKDADGVPDIDDRCADTKAMYKVDLNGCPKDDDNDGVLNEEDACPTLAGILSLKGCPDTDGDGVADNEDHCPKVIGTIANKGCPELTKEDAKAITTIGSKLFFETNSAKLLTASFVQLDELVKILQRYEAANLQIGGHTDNQGDDTYNLTLSQQRTETVKNYLMGKGIMESRLTAIGYGETQPLADNATALGRAKNRRVELKTAY